MMAAVDMLETRVMGIPISADTLDKPVKLSFRYKAGDIPMTASVSREGKTLRLDAFFDFNRLPVLQDSSFGFGLISKRLYVAGIYKYAGSSYFHGRSKHTCGGCVYKCRITK